MKIFPVIFILATLLLPGCKSPDPANRLTFFQLNLWYECDRAPGAFESLVDLIVDLEPDIASFCELYRAADDPAAVITRLVAELSSKGLDYNYETGNGRGVISKYPLAEPSDLNGSVFKVVVELPDRDVTVYSAHLFYRYYSGYLPRGYMDGGDGRWEKLDEPVTDPSQITERCYMSGRPDHIREVIADADRERALGRTVILAGDFNEPSHLDWTEATKNLWDHNGTVVGWPVSSILYECGFRDVFREAYPDPAAVPGFTFPAGNTGVAIEELTWAPDADERERIDFIYYIPTSGFSHGDITAVGPQASVERGKITTDPDHRNILEPQAGCWPSDHKGLLATFILP